MENDGYALSDADDSGFDLVFSFDLLVHAEIDVLKSYVPQIIQKLNNYGVAFIHYSNVGAFGTALSQTFGRGASVSRENVEGLVVGSGGRTVIQEIINWHTSAPVDCLTLFARGGSGGAAPCTSSISISWRKPRQSRISKRIIRELGKVSYRPAKELG